MLHKLVDDHGNCGCRNCGCGCGCCYCYASTSKSTTKAHHKNSRNTSHIYGWVTLSRASESRLPDDPYGSRFATRRNSDIPPPPFQYPTPRGAILQVGILTAEGGSANSAAPDRTILPLFGRELDSRRGRWNYYTRTDGTNPVQVPVRVGNRLCDDDTNGCNEVYSDDSVHVPALGRSFRSTIYKSSF